MFFKLLILFISVPLIELAILLKLGNYIGVFNTILIVIVTGIIGASLAKLQGLKVLYNIKDKMNTGEMPTEDIIDGFLILAAGLVLLTPGLLTDTLGFLILIPITRKHIKEFCKKQFNKIASTRQTDVHRFRDYM